MNKNIILIIDPKEEPVTNKPMPFFKLSGRLLHDARTKYEKRFLPTSFLTPGMCKMQPSTMGINFFRWIVYIYNINVRVFGCPIHYIFHYLAYDTLNT